MNIDKNFRNENLAYFVSVIFLFPLPPVLLGTEHRALSMLRELSNHEHIYPKSLGFQERFHYVLYVALELILWPKLVLHLIIYPWFPEI